MSSLRRPKPIPIPGADLARLKATLHPDYGSQLHSWTDEGGETHHILVVRVPRDDPDMVNDVEQCVEYLHPGELADAAACLLVGNRHTLLVPPQPLRELMASRVRFDRSQCQLLRSQLAHGEHRLFKAPEDTRRLVRLAWRVARLKVGDLQEGDLVACARDLGPRLDTPAYKEVRSVYLVADADDVRMDADLFFQDLRERWTEESERQRLAEEIVEKEAAQRSREEAERKALVPLRIQAPIPRVATAPLRQPTPAGPWESDSVLASSDPQRAAMYARLDAMLGVAPPPSRPASAAQDPAEPAGLAPFPPPSPPTGAEKLPPPWSSPHLGALHEALAASGFDVLRCPPGPHGMDLAAERSAGFPNRVIAYLPPRLDVALAEKVLAAAKGLQVDIAFVVCEEAEPEARKRFIATRARWVEPASLAGLRL